MTGRAELITAPIAAGVGEGFHVRLSGAKVHGAGLLVDGLVHLELFRPD